MDKFDCILIDLEKVDYIVRSIARSASDGNISDVAVGSEIALELLERVTDNINALRKSSIETGKE